MFNVNTRKLASHLNCFEKELPSLLDADRVSDILDDLNYSFRNRVFTPFVTLQCFLSQAIGANSSCLDVISEMAVWRRLNGLGDICLNSGSYCKAKARLPLELIKRLARNFSDSLGGPEDEDFGRVFVVDGTGISMSDTKSNVRVYPKHGGDGKGKGFPSARLLALFSLSTGGLIDLKIGPMKGKGSGELTLLRKLWDNMRPGDTLLGDALFTNFPVLAFAANKGVHVVSELPAKMCKNRIEPKKKNQIITLEKPRKSKSTDQKTYGGWPDAIKVRVIKVLCAPNGFRPQAKYILTTNLSAIPAKRIGDLYKKRWEVEVNFRSIKQTMGMDILRSCSPSMFEKEVWTFALAYNLVRAHMLQTGVKTKELPSHLSFGVSLMLVRAIRTACFLGKHNQEDLFDLILRAKAIGTRPNRYEPRAVKRRKKNFAFLSTDRQTAKNELHKKRKF